MKAFWLAVLYGHIGMVYAEINTAKGEPHRWLVILLMLIFWPVSLSVDLLDKFFRWVKR